MASYETLGLGSPLLQNSMRLGDALKLAEEGKINLVKDQSPFSLWKLSQDVKSSNLLVSSFAKACVALFSDAQIHMQRRAPVQPLLERRLERVELAGRGHVQANGGGTVTKDSLNRVEARFLKEVQEQPTHPLRRFVPEIRQLDQGKGSVVMEDLSLGIKDRDNDLLDVKIGRHIANREELLAHDYRDKNPLSLGFKMFRMEVLEKLTGAPERGYTFIPQSSDRLQRMEQGLHSEQQIGQRLASKSMSQMESLVRQLRELKNAVEADRNNAFVACSVLLAFPENGEPRVKLIDFAHRMQKDEFVAPSGFDKKSAQSFEQCRTDFIFGIGELLKLAGGEVQRRRDEFGSVNKQLVNDLLDHEKVLANGMKQDYVGLFFASNKHRFAMDQGLGHLPPARQDDLRKAVKIELLQRANSGMPLDEKTAIDAIKRATCQWMAQENVLARLSGTLLGSARAKGLELPLAGTAHDKLQSAISAKLLGEFRNHPDEDPLTLAEGVVRKEVDKFLAVKQKLLAALDEMHVGGRERDVLTRFILKNEDVLSLSQFEQILATREVSSRLVDALKNPSTSRGDLVEALSQFGKDCNARLLTLKTQAVGKDFGKDEEMAFPDHALSLRLDEMKAREALRAPDIERIFQRLASPELSELRDVLSSNLVPYGRSEFKQAMGMLDALSSLTRACGEMSGKTEGEIRQAASVPGKVGTLEALPDDLRVSLRGAGVLPLPPPAPRTALPVEQQRKVDFLLDYAKGDYVRDFIQSEARKNGENTVEALQAHDRLPEALALQKNVQIQALLESQGLPTEDRIARFFGQDVGRYGLGANIHALDDLPRDSVQWLRERVKTGLEDLMRAVRDDSAFDKEAPSVMRTTIWNAVEELKLRDRQYDDALQNGGVVPRHDGTSGSLSASARKEIENWVHARVGRERLEGNFLKNHRVPDDLLPVMTRVDEALLKDIGRQNYTIGGQECNREDPVGTLRTFAGLFRKDGVIDFETMDTVSSILNQNGDGALLSSKEFLEALGMPPLNNTVGYRRCSVVKDGNGFLLKIESQGKSSLGRGMEPLKDLATSNNFIDYALTVRVSPPPKTGAPCGVHVMEANYRFRMD